MEAPAQTIQHNDQTTPRARLRDWATPVTTGGFILTAATGMLLFFKVQSGLIQPVHEWLSLVFVGGAILHAVVNWRPLVRCFSRPRARAILATSALLLGAALLWPTPGGGLVPPKKTQIVLQHSSLATVAQLANHSPEEAVQRLARQGIRANSGQGIQAIAEANGATTTEILAAVFQQEKTAKTGR